MFLIILPAFSIYNIKWCIKDIQITQTLIKASLNISIFYLNIFFIFLFFSFVYDEKYNSIISYEATLYQYNIFMYVLFSLYFLDLHNHIFTKEIFHFYCSRLEREGWSLYFQKFKKKLGKLYKKNSSIYPIFKNQFIYMLILYVIFKKNFRIDGNNKQIIILLYKRNFIKFYA